jgi:nucleoside-diphosphate-sugar epimerase
VRIPHLHRSSSTYIARLANGSSNLELLRTAKKYAKSLKHVSITGSINSITTGADLATRTLTNDSWVDITQDQARSAQDSYISYCSVKKEAELAVWAFVKTESPSFGITVFLPALIFGPPIQPVRSVKKLNFSADLFYGLWDGRNEVVPDTMFPSYIDVRDLAEAQVKALTTPGADNKRFLVGGMPLTFTAIVRAIKTLVEKGDLPKEAGEKLPKESGEETRAAVPKIEAKEGNETLALSFRSLEETVKDTVRKILEIKAKET